VLYCTCLCTMQTTRAVSTTPPLSPLQLTRPHFTPFSVPILSVGVREGGVGAGGGHGSSESTEKGGESGGRSGEGADSLIVSGQDPASAESVAAHIKFAFRTGSTMTQVCVACASAVCLPTTLRTSDSVTVTRSVNTHSHTIPYKPCSPTGLTVSLTSPTCTHSHTHAPTRTRTVTLTRPHP
jgi:hypothetical protein